MFKFTLVHWTWTFIFLSLSFLSFKETLVGPTSIFGREGIIVYKCTSHPFNIRNSTPYRFVTDSSETTLSKLNLKSFNSSVKSTLKRNLQNAQYFRTFMMDEWEVHLHLYTIFPSLPLVVSRETLLESTIIRYLLGDFEFGAWVFNAFWTLIFGIEIASLPKVGQKLKESKSWLCI